MRHSRYSFITLLVAALAMSSACAPTATNDAAPAEAVAAEPKPTPPRALAEATNAARTLHVAVLQAKRTQDTVRIELAFTYTPPAAPAAAGAPQASSTPSDAPPAPAPLPLLRTLAGDAGEANPADFCLLTADGARHLFLMRDAQGAPVLEGDWQKPLPPTERRVLAATFPAPPPARAAVPGRAAPEPVSAPTSAADDPASGERAASPAAAPLAPAGAAEPSQNSPASSAAPAIPVRVTLVLGRIVLRDVPIS